MYDIPKSKHPERNSSIHMYAPKTYQAMHIRDLGRHEDKPPHALHNIPPT